MEFFFATSVISFFSGYSNSDIFIETFKTIPIYHVFGKVGNLPWENKEKSRKYDHAGLDKYQSWDEIGKELFTIYEAEKKELHKTIIKNIKMADEVHFLGFGFNSFNLKFLELNSWSDNIYISGTRYGLSDSEILDINTLFNDKLKKISKYDNYDCYNYLKEEVSFFIDKTDNIPGLNGL